MRGPTSKGRILQGQMRAFDDIIYMMLSCKLCSEEFFVGINPVVITIGVYWRMIVVKFVEIMDLFRKQFHLNNSVSDCTLSLRVIGNEQLETTVCYRVPCTFMLLNRAIRNESNSTE